MLSTGTKVPIRAEQAHRSSELVREPRVCRAYRVQRLRGFEIGQAHTGRSAGFSPSSLNRMVGDGCFAKA
jgi:hypothetical protein